MPARKGPKKVNRYSIEMKRTAVRLSNAPGARVMDVAEALDIHPFMLSRWRKLARKEGATRLYWFTQEHNAAARALYDKVARYNGFIRYDYPAL